MLKDEWASGCMGQGFHKRLVVDGRHSSVPIVRIELSALIAHVSPWRLPGDVVPSSTPCIPTSTSALSVAYRKRTTAVEAGRDAYAWTVGIFCLGREALSPWTGWILPPSFFSVLHSLFHGIAGSD